MREFLVVIVTAYGCSTMHGFMYGSFTCVGGVHVGSNYNIATWHQICSVVYDNLDWLGYHTKDFIIFHILLISFRVGVQFYSTVSQKKG